MVTVAEAFLSVFRDFETDGQPSTGPHTVLKSEARALGGTIQTAIEAALAGAVAGSASFKATIAALRATTWADTPDLVIVLASHFAGDGGGLFRRDASDAESEDDDGIIIVDADDNRWKRQIDNATFNPVWWGAQRGFLASTTQNRDAFQASLNAAAAVHGEAYWPAGLWQIASPGLSLTNVGPVTIRGAGMGMGPGGVMEGGTQILAEASFSSGDIITLSGLQGFIVRDMCIRGVHYLARSSGAGIKISGVGTNFNAQSRVENVAFSCMYRGVEFHLCAFHIQTHCWHTSWTEHAAVATTEPNYEGGGGKIDTCFFIGNLGEASQGAAVRLRPGTYCEITDCGFLGAQYGIYATIQDQDSADHLIRRCIFEEVATSSIRYETGGKSLKNLAIDQCTFSNFDADELESHIAIAGGTWLKGLSITGNKVYSNINTNGFAAFIIAAGQIVDVSNNVLNGNGNTNYFAIFMGSDLVAPVQCYDNVIHGYNDAKYGINAATKLRDMEGLAFANVPSSCANGSMIYVTDGTAGSSPLTGSGSGCIAVRQNGAWKGL